jgi:hypothetical protein
MACTTNYVKYSKLHDEKVIIKICMKSILRYAVMKNELAWLAEENISLREIVAILGEMLIARFTIAIICD